MPNLWPPPSGLDRADGSVSSGGVGTITPGNAVIKTPTSYFLEELDDSPQIERGEQCTIVHKFKCDPFTAYNILFSNYRGRINQDSLGILTRVLSASSSWNKGDFMIVTVTSEVMAPNNDEGFLMADLPPDEFRVEESELNPEVAKHPKFKDLREYNFQPDLITPTNTAYLTGAQIIDNVVRFNQTQQFADANQYLSLISADQVPSSRIRNLAAELAYLYRRQEDNFFLSGVRVQWSTFFWLCPAINPGDYIEDPVTAGGLPAYFWSQNGASDGRNQLDPSTWSSNPNQNMYHDGVSWLRKRDTCDFQRNHFRLTRTWYGAPIGKWDSFLYGDTQIT